MRRKARRSASVHAVGMNRFHTPSVRRLALATALLMPMGAHAADVYRWVDENGRVQFSDTVPEKYRDKATRLDTRPSELTDAQRREAEARALQARAKAADVAAAQARAASAPPRPPPAPVAAASAAAPTSTDCATLHRLYQESQDCFGPYRTVHGTTKAEGYEKCTVVADPTPQCGHAAPR